MTTVDYRLLKHHYYGAQINYCLFSRWTKLCFNKKSFLKNLAGHLAQLYWALSALDTAMWLVFRWTNKFEFWVNLSPHRLHLRITFISSNWGFSIATPGNKRSFKGRFYCNYSFSFIWEMIWRSPTWRGLYHCCRCMESWYQQHS